MNATPVRAGEAEGLALRRTLGGAARPGAVKRALSCLSPTDFETQTPITAAGSTEA